MTFSRVDEEPKETEKISGSDAVLLFVKYAEPVLPKKEQIGDYLACLKNEGLKCTVSLRCDGTHWYSDDLSESLIYLEGASLLDTRYLQIDATDKLNENTYGLRDAVYTLTEKGELEVGEVEKRKPRSAELIRERSPELLDSQRFYSARKETLNGIINKEH